MSKIYRESLTFFLASLPVLLVGAAVMEGLLWLTGSTSETGFYVALTFLAYLFHRHFLFGEALTFSKQPIGAGWSVSRLGLFVLVSVCVVFLPLVFGAVLILAILGDLPFLAFLLLAMAFYLLSFGLFGTALPAVVANDGTFRLSQGLRVSGQTMWRLILGPGFTGLGMMILTLLGGQLIETLGATEDSLVTLVWYVVIRTLGFLPTILAVAVLCDMYRRTRPEPHAPQDGAQGSLGLDQTPA